MIISLTGGLGNQLFQYFAGLSFLSDAENLLITSDFGSPRSTRDVTDLEFFSLHKDTKILRVSKAGRVTRKAANLALTRNLSTDGKESKLAKNGFLDSCLPFYFSLLLGKRVSVFSSDAVGYTSNIPNSNSLVFGYFQSHKYFLSLPQHKRVLTLKSESSEFKSLKKRIMQEKPLVLHVRLGDYLKEKHFGVLTNGYYSKGIEFHEREEGQTKIWLFSDDPVHALEMLPTEAKERIFVVPKNILNPAESLELMRYGSRYLIANSSFSWWGAMLTYSTSTNVVAPAKWFNGMNDPYELIPENWELLSR